MFYANNEQVKGIFLNGRNYNYLSSGFGKIIPEDRNSEQLNLNLAYKYLNQYRIEWGTVKDGYENALVSPRFDKPVNGVFRTPFTYYYGGNIIPTKQVPVLITDGDYALSNALVYNDMNINGAINHFASNTDFQGHNVNVFPEEDNYQSSPLLYYEMLNNCSNFDLNISTRFSKASPSTLYNCNNFSGNFKYVGNEDNKYPGFRGFLEDCKDGIFNIDCTNMHGGGSDANVTNYYNFSGIQGCNNIKLNITGSSWQVWPHDHSFSSNCNISTYNVISGFGYMNDCNFDIVLPKDSKPEMDKPFDFLNNAENCNYNLNALDVNLLNYRSVGYVPFFNSLNNCNLNLLVNNAVEFGDSLGGNFNNCNIVFDNIKGNLISHRGWGYLYNCNITGNVEAASSKQGFIEYCDGLNINLNAAKSSRILPMWRCHHVNGNIVAGNMTYIYYSSYSNLNVSSGGLILTDVEHSRLNANGTNIDGTNLNNCMFEIHNSKDFIAHTASNCNFNMYNSVGTAILNKLNNVKFVERGGANYKITNISKCYNSRIHANTVDGLLENVYDTRLELKNNNPNFHAWRVNNCEITGFPTIVHYTTNCTFRVPIPSAVSRNSHYVTWANVWLHAIPRGGDGWNTWYMTKTGLRSVDNFSDCYLNCTNGSLVEYSTTFNNVNNMQTDIRTFYNGVVTANLPMYNTEIKFNVDCKTLNLGIFQAVPPHGFANSSISANDIYATGRGAGSSYHVLMGRGARLYCANYCNVPFTPVQGNSDNSNLPVLLINNYQHSNTAACKFHGGLTRIGRLNFQGGASIRLELTNSACVFINNAILDGADVDGSLLFVGSNVTWTSPVNVTNSGVIANSSNWGPAAHYLLVTRSLAWNVWDSGPWGSRSLLDFCKNV